MLLFKRTLVSPLSPAHVAQSLTCSCAGFRKRQLEERISANNAAEQALQQDKQESHAQHMALEKSRAEVQQLSKKVQDQQVRSATFFALPVPYRAA